MAGSDDTAFGGTAVPDLLAQFLIRVLAWGAPGEPTSYVNIHAWTPKARPRDSYPRKGGGRAYASMLDYGQLQQFVWLLNRDGDEGFFCISTRSAHGGELRGGHFKASRNKAVNRPVQLKSFVLDLDVKKGAYPSQRSALAAVLPFLDGLGLRPGPIVDTGAGLHVYITLTEPITPAIWQPLCNALIEATKQAGIKFDVAVTRDDDRVLRLPSTYNRKDPDNPKLCRVMDLGVDTTLADLEKALAAYMGVQTVAKPNGHAVLDPAILPPRPPIHGPEADRVSAERDQQRVVTSASLLCNACPVVADSYDRGGDGDAEPLWFELAKLCHYVEHGQAFFHLLSNQYSGKHGDYSPEETDRKYDEVQKGGWPHCQTIADSSPEAKAICETCRYWPDKRTPIHAALYGHETPPINGHSMLSQTFAGSSKEIQPNWVPPDYTYSKGWLLYNGKPAFFTLLHDVAGVYQHEGDAYSMAMKFAITRGTKDTDDSGNFSIPTSVLASQTKFHEAILNWGLIPNREVSKERNVGLDLLTQIQQQRTAVTQQRAGWVGKEFAYGGKIYTANGPRSTGRSPIPHLVPRGNLADWKTAIAGLTSKGCTEMEIVMVTGYTGPLVEMTGVHGCLLHVFGETGRGKSLACTAACSVACDPNAIVEDKTAMASAQRVATFNNIPVFFDEFVQDDVRALHSFAQLVKNITSGKGKLRLNTSGKERDVSISRNQVVSFANRRLTEASKVNTTQAQEVRIVEIEMTDALQRSGITQTDIVSIGKALQKNYGVAMEVYIDFIVRNYDAVNRMVQETMRYLEQRLTSTHQERFWVAQLAIIFVAASIARKLDLQQFDVGAIRKFLLNWYQYQRNEMRAAGAGADSPEFQMQLLRTFHNENLDKRLTTPHLPARGGGRQAVEEIMNGILLRPKELAFRVARQDRRMFVSEAKLRDWHRARGGSYDQMKATLVKHGYCEYHRKNKSIGGSTLFPTAPEAVLEFNLSDPRNAGFLEEE